MGLEKRDVFLQDYLFALQTVAGLSPLRGISTGFAEGRGILHRFEQEFTPADTARAASSKRGRSLDAGVASSRAQVFAEVPDGLSRRKSTRTAGSKGGQRPTRRCNPVHQASVEGNEGAEPKRALTVKEAARVYSISRSSIYVLIEKGTLPDVVVSGRRLLPVDAMEKLIAGKRS